jgi:hypothetical protein
MNCVESNLWASFREEDFTGLDSGHASKLAYTAGIASLTSWQAA